MLVVFPPLDEMDALHWLHLALLSSVRLKYSQTLERLCLTGAMSASFLKRQRRVCGVITPMVTSIFATKPFRLYKNIFYGLHGYFFIKSFTMV